MVTATPDSPAPPPAKPSGWARWRGPVLFVSLGLNLFLVGTMAGSWWHHYPRFGRHFAYYGESGAPARARIGMAVIRDAIRQLPEADRKAFEDALAARRPQMQAQREEVRKARMKVNEAIRAEPFDAKAMSDALAGVRGKLQEMQTIIHAGFVEAVGKLPADKRREFADSVARLRARP